MADYDEMTPGQMLADLNVSEFVKQLALGIAEAQTALDNNSVAQTIRLAQTKLPGSDKSLLELGLVPAFYAFQKATLTVNLNLKFRVERSFSVDLGLEGNYNRTGGSGDKADATITVLYSTAQAATAAVRLSSASAGTLTVGATTLTLVPQGGGSLPTDVGFTANKVWQTAQDLAAAIKPPVVPDILRATASWKDPNPITPETDAPLAFACLPSLVNVKAFGTAKPAYAWVTILDKDAIKVTLLGNDVTWTAGLDVAATAIAATAVIEADGGYNAWLLVNNKKAVKFPHFDYNKTAILPVDIADLDRLAQWLSNDTTVTVDVVGHADPTGGVVYNNLLSLSRAIEVRDYLVSKGAPAANITTSGVGSSQSTNMTNADARRVEIKVKTGPDNVIAIESTATGVQAWGANPTFAPATSGQCSKKIDGLAGTGVPTSKYVKVNGYYFYVDPLPTSPLTPNYVFAWDADPAVTAKNLAAEINLRFSDAKAEAWVVGSTVHLLSTYAYALITMETVERSLKANDTALVTTGSLSPEAVFRGGMGLAEPKDGDTVTLGGTNYTCRVTTPGPNEFEKGLTDTITAQNLAKAIGSPYTAVASGAVVTVTGPAGTSIKTSNSEAFKLSASMLGGVVPGEGQASNRAVAFGGTLDVRIARQFAMDVQGNSSVSVELVALPPPVALTRELGGG